VTDPIDQQAWLSTIAHHPSLPATAFKLAWWFTQVIDAQGLVNLSDWERAGLGPRRTAQRALTVLEWAGYIKVTRRVRGGPGRYGTNTYELLMPSRQRKVA
jgi:hypothetical protein